MNENEYASSLDPPKAGRWNHASTSKMWKSRICTKSENGNGRLLRWPTTYFESSTDSQISRSGGSRWPCVVVERRCCCPVSTKGFLDRFRSSWHNVFANSSAYQIGYRNTINHILGNRYHTAIIHWNHPCFWVNSSKARQVSFFQHFSRSTLVSVSHSRLTLFFSTFASFFFPNLRRCARFRSGQQMLQFVSYMFIDFCRTFADFQWFRLEWRSDCRIFLKIWEIICWTFAELLAEISIQ
jgi:hypothetical protein